MRALMLLIELAAVIGTLAAFSIQPAVAMPLRVSVNSWVGYGPLYIAQEKGFFADEGLNVSIERIEGVGERRAALSAGRIDLLGSTIDDLVVGKAQGVDGRMVLAVDTSAGADGIVATQEIKSVRDLKGRTIAVQPGFVNHFFLLYLLRQENLSSKDITVLPMEPDKAGPAFVAGQIDVAVTWEPWLSKAAERPDGHVLITSSAAPGVIVDNFVARVDVIQQRPGDVRRFARAWHRAVRVVREQPAEANEIIARAFGLAPEEVADMLKGVRFYGEAENREFFASGRAQVVAQLASELWVEEGFIPAPVEAAEIIDPSFS